MHQTFGGIVPGDASPFSVPHLQFGILSQACSSLQVYIGMVNTARNGYPPQSYHIVMYGIAKHSGRYMDTGESFPEVRGISIPSVTGDCIFCRCALRPCYEKDSADPDMAMAQKPFKVLDEARVG